MSATMLNGKLPRKQLADQLNRLDEKLDRHDSILNSLAEGLNAAVQDAAQAGVQQAVKAAIIELLTNPELRQTLHQASAAPPEPEKPNFWQRCKAKWQSFRSQVSQLIPGVGESLTGPLATAKSKTTKAIAPIWRFRKILFAATGTGFLVTIISLLLSHNFAAMLSGLGAATTTLAGQIIWRVRQTVRNLTQF